MDGIDALGGNLLVWLVSGAGVVLGGLGSVLAMMSHRRSQALKALLVAIDEERKTERARDARRARLHAFLEQEVEVSWNLIIQNDGHGDASNLTVSVNGSQLESSGVIGPQRIDVSSINEIRARSGLRIPLKVVDRPSRLQLELTWSDASGELGFHEVELAP